MIFSWLKNRRRRRIVERPFPPAWEETLRANLFHDRLLTDEQRAKLRRSTAIMVAEKTWEACDGLVMNDEIKVTIAGQASVMLLGVDDYYFDRVHTVLVRPTVFQDRRARTTGGGVYSEGTVLSGEATLGGPIVLSWEDSLYDAREPDAVDNLVIHEFTHHLDALDGYFDGAPRIVDPALAARWGEVIGGEYRRHVKRLDAGRTTFLDPYGAHSPAEFFAVCSECFFMEPMDLREEHVELYAILRDFYQQDPAAWNWPDDGDE